MGLFDKISSKYKDSKKTLSDIEDDNTAMMISNNLIYLTAIDGSIDDEEVGSVIDILSDIWGFSEKEGLELFERFIEELKQIEDNSKLEENNISAEELIKSTFTNNTVELSKTLNNIQKKELLDLVIEVIQSDEVVDDCERELLVSFKENIKIDKGIWGGIKKALISIFSRTCDKCKSTNVELIDSEELDRWIGKKAVTERLASGKTKTRYIAVTFIEKRYTYQCNDCYHKQSEKVKEEKK